MMALNCPEPRNYGFKTSFPLDEKPPCDFMGQEIKVGDILMMYGVRIAFVQAIDLCIRCISPDGEVWFLAEKCLKLNNVNENLLALWVLADFRKIGP